MGDPLILLGDVPQAVLKLFKWLGNCLPIKKKTPSLFEDLIFYKVSLIKNQLKLTTTKNEAG